LFLAHLNRKGIVNTPNSIAGITSGRNITVYPNPAKEYITIPLADAVDCTLLDISGKKFEVRPSYANGATIISVAHFAPGTYILNCSEKTGQKYSSKLVVE
jgi:hypothetical protein